MSKNLTRKGFALGTVLALGASLFAGTPASAAPTALYLDTAFGTAGASQTGVLGQYFTLAASANGATAGDVVNFYVEGVTAANLTATGRYVTDLSASSATSAYVARTPSATSNDLKQASIASSAWVVGNYYQLALKVNSTNVTATTSVKVTPYLDSVIADGKPGPGEVTGTAVTINFVKGSELTATPTLTDVPLGAAATATVAVSGGVNLSQFRAAADGGHAEYPFTVDFKQSGADWASNVDRNAVWNTSTSTLEAVSANNTTGGLVYGATANINAVDSASATAVTATAGDVTGLTGVSMRASNSYKSSGSLIRSGSGTITARATVAATGKTLAQAVTFKISETGVDSLPTGATITAAGKTLTIAKSSTTEFIDVTITAGALEGHADLAISYTGITDSKAFNITASAQGTSAKVVGSTVPVLTAADSVATAIVDSVQVNQNVNTVVRNIARGGSFSIAYSVVDQFGQAPTGTFRVIATNTNALVTPSVASPIAVSGGNVTVSGTDNNSADDTYEIVATLQKLGTDGVTYANVGSVAQTSTILAKALKTPATIAITAATTTGIVRNLNSLVSGVSQIEQGSISRSFTSSNGQTMSAVVTDSLGAPVPGAAVTFSATGVTFHTGGTIRTNAGTFGTNSLVVYTDASGATGDVHYYSFNTGKQTITVTSGAATKTQDATFAAATTGVASGLSTWTVTAPTYILPGATLKVSAVLKDRFGAVIDTAAGGAKATYTGPGYLTAAMATETDADGAISFTVLLGAGDSGTGTVKFTFAGQNGTLEETVLNDDVVAQAIVTLGAAPAASATAAVAGSTKRFFVSVSGNTGAKNVVVKVAGKTFKTLKGSTAKKTYTVAAPKGSHKVTVYVGGKLVATKTISVK
jgi:hypothetical protein